MSIPETLLIFLGIPLGIVLLITLAVYGPSEMRAPGRYRPGRPWTHDPAWYLPNPAAFETTSGQAAIAAAPGDTARIDTAHIDTVRSAPTPVAAGGASGEW